MDFNYECDLSIFLITYNHEKYIQQTIESILSQKITDSWELVIHDDGSTDRTKEIIKEMCCDNNNIRLFLRNKNTGGKGGYEIRKKLNGRYIFGIEGDDYLYDDEGLQKMLTWLKDHDEYSGIAGRQISLIEKTGYMCKDYDMNTDNSIITLDDYLMLKKRVESGVILYKNFYHDGLYNYGYNNINPIVGDVYSRITRLLHGDIFQSDIIVKVYRTGRLSDSSNYNSLYNKKKIFTDYIQLWKGVNDFLNVELQTSKWIEEWGKIYAGYQDSLLDYIKETPYVIKISGISGLKGGIKTWIEELRK